jgi:hypothetical protein
MDMAKVKIIKGEFNQKFTKAGWIENYIKDYLQRCAKICISISINLSALKITDNIAQK